MYRFRASAHDGARRVQLLGVGRDPRRSDQGRRRPRGRAWRRRRRLERDQLQRAGARRRRRRERRGGTARAGVDAQLRRRAARADARARSSSRPTTFARCPSRSAPSCRPAGAASRSAPTASAAATRGRRCGATSRSMPRRSCRLRCARSADVEASHVRGERELRAPAGQSWNASQSSRPSDRSRSRPGSVGSKRAAALRSRSIQSAKRTTSAGS